MYLDTGRLRRWNSQQHLGHLVDNQLCDQLFIFLHVLTNQWHGAVHHLQQDSQSGRWTGVSQTGPTEQEGIKELVH